MINAFGDIKFLEIAEGLQIAVGLDVAVDLHVGFNGYFPNTYLH